MNLVKYLYNEFNYNSDSDCNPDRDWKNQNELKFYSNIYSKNNPIFHINYKTLIQNSCKIYWKIKLFKSNYINKIDLFGFFF